MSFLEFIESLEQRSDKYDLGYIEHFYNEYFTPRKESVSRILEIGVLHGHSLLHWHDWFINAQIHGVDPHPYYHSTSSRINLHITNAYTKAFVDSFPKNHFDIIIDDGPHDFNSQLFFCEHYINLVKPGGLLILEDIIDLNHTAVFLDKLADYKTKVVNMAGLARTAELQQRWAQGLDCIIVEK